MIIPLDIAGRLDEAVRLALEQAGGRCGGHLLLGAQHQVLLQLLLMLMLLLMLLLVVAGQMQLHLLLALLGRQQLLQVLAFLNEAVEFARQMDALAPGDMNVFVFYHRVAQVWPLVCHVLDEICGPVLCLLASINK